MEDFEQTIVLGVVFDISNKSYRDKKHLLSSLKEKLIQFATSLGLNCGIWVNQDIFPRRQGESVAGIADYKEAEKFDIENATRQALYAVGNQEDHSKYVVILTDRYSEKQKYRYEKVAILNQTKKFNCQIIFLDFSGKCPDFDHSKTFRVNLETLNISDYLENGKSV